MAGRSLKRVQCDDPVTARDAQFFQDNVDEAIASAINHEPVYGRRVDGITLPNASTVKFAHKLGRIPVEVTVCNLKRSGATVPAVSLESSDATFLTFYSSAPGSCSVRVC